ncbi:MAG: molybdopterin-dependent oxidoreductase [Pseudoflavonifractor sp.]
MTELERKLKAKIPGEDTGITVHHSICDICSPGMHCGVDAYVKDGVIIKVEGTCGHPVNDGKLCTKGLSNRGYVYRPDRLQTPLRRVGKRGEGKFEPISWDEAYREIAQRLNAVKAQYGAEAVAFYSGYSKWYRQTLRRFAYAFGSPNYGCESSACYTAAFMAWKVTGGDQANPDMDHSDLFLGWAYNPFYSNYMSARHAMACKERGLKFIIVDPRTTPATEKLADLVLRPRSGTDGALALAIANVLITRGWTDDAFIRDYVYGYEDYANYAKGFNESNIEALTDVPYPLVVKAAEMIHESRATSFYESSAPLTHHRNGLQNYRAILGILAITGNIDRPGGQVPVRHTYMHVDCGFQVREEEFMYENRPKDVPLPIGAERFPLWNQLEGEMQAMDLPRQILSGKPYPVRAVFGVGMNARMWPDSGHMFKALEALDFFVDTDLFMSDTAKYADIVLPACTSFERGEFKPYSGGKAIYTKPVIPPLYDSKPDVDMLCELANVMDLPDPLLRSGYEACINYIIRDLNVTTEDLKKAELPIVVAPVEHPAPLEHLKAGLRTPTGKIELSSALIEGHPEWKLDPLPTYRAPMDDADETVYPFILTSGSRIPNAIHSRLHGVATARALRPNPTADMNAADCAALDLRDHDKIAISTLRGQIIVEVHPTESIPPRHVNFYHGYSEADANSLMDGDHLDPYSGFPAYRSTRCAVRKEA